MSEVWLRSNATALRAALIPLALAALAGGLTAALAGPLWVRMAGGGAAVAATLAAGVWAWLMGRPRLSFDGRHVLVNLRPGRPIRLPLEVVECCFLGQRPAQLSGPGYEGSKMAAVVLRLAESASEWSSMRVEPSLGQWEDSYITLYGTWCEPLNLDRVNQINQCLQRAHEARGGQRGSSCPA